MFSAVPTTKQEQQQFYAVARGRETGIFTSYRRMLWCVDGYPSPVFRKFDALDAAGAFVARFPVVSGGSSGAETAFAWNASDIGYVARVDIEFTDAGQQHFQHVNLAEERTAAVPTQFYYAVARGRQTGVFATWDEAKKHVEGLFSASFKKFPSEEEAKAFVQQVKQITRANPGDPDPKHPDTLVAFCDGSALRNGRRGCQAGYACVFPHCEAWNVAKKLIECRPTNNRAEYFAALEAMKRANLEDAVQHRVLFIFSDSMLLIRSMTEWIGKWRRNNWCKADGTPVLNRDILEQLVAEQGERRVVWRHVKAHTGKKDWRSKWNDVADRAAREAARRSPV